MARRRQPLPAPVISVGNIHSGGSGKTPIVSELVNRLRDKRPIILSRGYGRRDDNKKMRVNLDDPKGPETYGDEPFFLAKTLGVPVYVGTNRFSLGQIAYKELGSGLFILDDGFQHHALARDIDLVLINTSRDPAESFCLPLGELREPLSAVNHADAVLLVGGETDSVTRWEKHLLRVAPGLKIFRAIRKIEGLFERGLPVKVDEAPLLGGFAGLAYPESFFSDLRRIGALGLTKAYPDHHTYSRKDVAQLIALKKEGHLSYLVTTSKDIDKVSPLFEAFKERVCELRIRYEIDNDFWYFLSCRLEQLCGPSRS